MLLLNEGRPPREWASGLLLSLKQAKDYVAKEGRFVTENLNAWYNIIKLYMKILRNALNMFVEFTKN